MRPLAFRSSLYRTLARFTVVASLTTALVREARATDARTLTLADAIALARANAPSVRAALARVTVEEARIDVARATTLPVLTASATGEAFLAHGALYVPGVVSTDTSYRYLTADATLSASWVMTDFGRTSRATRAAALTADAASRSARTEELAAATQAALAFHVVVYDDELRAVAEATLAQRERQLSITRALVKAGVRNPIDELRASVALEASKLDVAAADGTSRKDAASLASALALDPATGVNVTPANDVEVDSDPARAGDAAVRESPAVSELARQAEAARARGSAAHAGRYPTLASRASGGVRYTRGPDLGIASPSQQAEAAIVLSVPLFDGSVNAKVRVADAEADVADAELARVTLAVRTEATSAALDVARARAIGEQAERLAAGARANLSQVEARYASGLMTPLELLDAQGVDTTARVAVVRAKRDVALAKTRLLSTTGRLLGAPRDERR